MDAVIGELVTSGSTAETQLTITNASPNLEHEFLITVISGTVKFGKGSVNANAHSYAADKNLIITCKPSELYFKAASALDTFVVTV